MRVGWVKAGRSDGGGGGVAQTNQLAQPGRCQHTDRLHHMTRIECICHVGRLMNVAGVSRDRAGNWDGILGRGIGFIVSL